MDYHLIIGALMAWVFSAILNYQHGEPVIIEATLSSGLSVALGAGILAYGLDPRWIIFAGGIIGCIGFNEAVNIIRRRLDG